MKILHVDGFDSEFVFAQLFWLLHIACSAPIAAGTRGRRASLVLQQVPSIQTKMGLKWA